MSGGSLNYFYSDLEDHANDFDDVELYELVKDLAVLFHDREWYLSCDTCEGSWEESRKKFKDKWFRSGYSYERVEEIVEKQFTDLKDKLMKSFGVFDRYCKNCKYHGTDDGYGYAKCQFRKGVLMHAYETCDKFRKKA